MSGDLIKRLREGVARHDPMASDATMDEAADEIEDLRRVIAELVETIHGLEAVAQRAYSDLYAPSS